MAGAAGGLPNLVVVAVVIAAVVAVAAAVGSHCGIGDSGNSVLLLLLEYGG